MAADAGRAPCLEPDHVGPARLHFVLAHGMSAAVSIREIDRGIVFLMAEWSGPAQWAWGQLREFVESYQATKPNLIKIEWQDAEAVYSLPELHGRVHGWGEVVVVKGGRIVFFTALGKEKTEVQNKCQELLRAYEG